MKTAMILAAGRGERLKPLTDLIPKAMCLVANKPLITHHVENLAHSGFERIVINHAYLGSKVRQFLGNGQQFGVEIIYSPEPPGGLETGGGIINALSLLGNAPFLTINADIFTDYSFEKLIIPSNSLAHLVVVPKNPLLDHYGDFGLATNHLLTDDNRNYTFAGIACYRPEFFKNCRLGRYSLTPLLRSNIQLDKVSGEVHHGAWFDIGSEKRLHEATLFADL